MTNKWTINDWYEVDDHHLRRLAVVFGMRPGDLVKESLSEYLRKLGYKVELTGEPTLERAA